MFFDRYRQKSVHRDLYDWQKRAEPKPVKGRVTRQQRRRMARYVLAQAAAKLREEARREARAVRAAKRRKIDTV